MKQAIVFAACLIVVAGCTKIDYVGEEFAPTEHVDLFFNAEDIEQEYRIMGHVIATAGDIVSSEKMQNDILKKAREKGADAVLIEGFERYVTGESSSWSEETKESKGKTITTGSSSSDSEEKKEIKAIFLKYK